MSQRPINELKPGQAPSWMQWNTMANAVNGIYQTRGTGGIKTRVTRNGIVIDGRGAATSTTATTYWAEVTATLTHDSVDEYTVQRIDSSGVKSGTDITIDRALGYEGYDAAGTDIRNFMPWFEVGSIVPIAKHYDSAEDGMKWFINLSMVFIGLPVDRSLDIYEADDRRAMAVWK